MAKPQSKKGRRSPVRSKYCKQSRSGIHQRGLFASRKIPEDTEIIEYVGEVISKEEGDRRAHALVDKTAGTDNPAVYIFILNDEFDIDGNIPENTARLINHSCDPNCEAQTTEDDEIWIVSLREIAKGEELTFDYGFELENYEDHPCRCGRPNCVGYIVARQHWPELKKLLKKAKKKAAAPPKKKAASKVKKAASKKASVKKKTPAQKKSATKKAAKKKTPAKKKKAASKKKARAKKKRGGRRK